MTANDYAQKVVELIDARPARIDLDKLLCEVYVRAKIAEARRDQAQGKWSTQEQVMERMWERSIPSSMDATGRKRPRNDHRRNRARRANEGYRFRTTPAQWHGNSSLETASLRQNF